MPEDKRRQATSEPEELARRWAEIAERSRRLVADFLARQEGEPELASADPLRIGAAFLESTARLMSEPEKLVASQTALWRDYMGLWQDTLRRLSGEKTEPAVSPARGDRRFRHPDWDENHLFAFIKQSYLMTARWLQATVGDIEGLDETTARKVDFYTRQFVDAMAPTNFLLTNPEVLRATVESRGDNLLKGLRNLLDDLERGKGSLSISTTDPKAFRVGGNLAVTPGKVIFQNELMQLLQYAPTTPKVRKRPLVIVPPWMNKYYILDLRPENSFVRWVVAQGYTVFVLSWVNPDERLREKTFEDYMVEGPLAALDAVEKATGEHEITAIGYCIGGTLLAATLAAMARREDDRIAAATYLATLVDFAEPGDLQVFIDEEQLSVLEKRMDRQGYLEGSAMAATFSLLRANDLIWNYVVNNYLLGRDPLPFDILHWNADSTNLPAAMHKFYLRKMYHENRLIQPGGIRLGGVPIDLRRIRVPAYILATHEDHIAPWASCYRATRLYRGPVRFVLAASGHVAGVVNPPVAHKYGHWTNRLRSPAADAWLASASYHEGSWWPDWERWARRRAGPLVPARRPGEGALQPIEDAPGSYVMSPAPR